MKFIPYLFLIFSISWFASCSEDKPEPEAEKTISISKPSLKVGADPSTEKIAITSNSKWTVKPADTWYTIKTTSGEGNGEIEITFKDNLTGAKRTSNISFITESKTVKLPVEQDKKLVLNLPSTSFTIEKAGGVVTIVADKEYTPIVPADIDWVTFAKGSDGVWKMTVKTNTTIGDRICRVTFKNGSEIIDVLIVQGVIDRTLELEFIKIDDIPCILDTKTKEFFFPIDMDASSALTHKIEFHGLGVDHIVVEGSTKKIKSGESFTFNSFNANSKIKINAHNELVDKGKTITLNITGLPIISINAPQGIVDEPKKPCDMIFIDPKGRTNFGTQKSLKYFESYGGIEFRGSGAQRYVKKSFGFKLRERGTENSVDAQLLGLRDDNSWILDAMWLDKGRMRNRVCFDMWNEFNAPYYKEAFEPKALSGTNGHLVEVFLDGTYHGMYMLSDRLDRKQLKLKKDGGYLYKCVDWSEECMLRGTTSPYRNSSLVWNGVEMDYPEEVALVEFKYYDNLIKFVNQTSTEEFSQKFEEKIDIMSMIDCFLMTNLMMAYDNLGRNTFWAIYNAKSGVADAEKMVPLVWDLDGTFGRSWDRRELNADTEFLVRSEHNGASYRIYRRIMNENPANIKEKMKARWNELKAGALSKERVNEKIDRYTAQQVKSGAQDREINRWNGNPEYDYSNVQGEAGYMKSWYEKRWNKMDQMINGSELNRTNW